MYSLNGKLALITGAASGLGLAIAFSYAKHGADLVLVDMSNNVHNVAKQIQEEIISKQGLNTVVNGYICDVTNAAQVNELFDEINEKYKKVPNVVVNSAGIGVKKDFIDMSESDFDRVMTVNVKGSFLIAQAAAKRLVSEFENVKFENDTQSYASIIYLSSQAGKHGIPGACSYSASKSAVEGLTRATAKELGKYRIRVNAVLPYFVDTPLIGHYDQATKTYLAGRCALGRLGKAEEIADLCLYLASDFSTYITGSSIDIHGGF